MQAVAVVVFAKRVPAATFSRSFRFLVWVPKDALIHTWYKGHQRQRACRRVGRLDSPGPKADRFFARGESSGNFYLLVRSSCDAPILLELAVTPAVPVAVVCFLVSRFLRDGASCGWQALGCCHARLSVHRTRD